MGDRAVVTDVCAGCGLIRGIGFPGLDGSIIEPDPDPLAPGLHIGSRWFCSAECLDDLHDRELEADTGPPIRCAPGGFEGPEHPACDLCGTALGYHSDDTETRCAACEARDLP